MERSVKTCQPLTSLIEQQQQPLLGQACDQVAANRSAASSQRRKAINEAASLRTTLLPPLQRAMDIYSDKSAFHWLTVLPMTSHGFSLPKAAFRDALCMRYNWQPDHLPSHCSCGQAFSDTFFQEMRKKKKGGGSPCSFLLFGQNCLLLSLTQLPNVPNKAITNNPVQFKTVASNGLDMAQSVWRSLLNSELWTSSIEIRFRSSRGSPPATSQLGPATLSQDPGINYYFLDATLAEKKKELFIIHSPLVNARQRIDKQRNRVMSHERKRRQTYNA